ncbi:hypothetical protein ElyMa_005648800 [Elysia marginata]|uniref:Uncharacterized protein n=1 Tax=Elysia marginata TaxID=1093978 RepID=A0AAV4FBG5_9GAST|nr:hypothetical protein ElyMa_005648800 [Elysia marginata]
MAFSGHSNIKKVEPTARQTLGPAGISTERAKTRFRNALVIEMEPLQTYRTANTWNYPGSLQHSSIPTLVIGLPFDTSKPRRGRWGEIPGTMISDSAAPIEHVWNEKMSRWQREQKAIEEARADLQKRIEICLYGKPRDTPVQPVCPHSPDQAFEKPGQRL